MKKSYYFFVLFVLSGTSVFAQVDYATQIQTIFNANCTSCHGGTSGVILTDYSSTMASVGSQYGTNVVIAGDADGSPLVDKIEPSPDHGSRMPQGGVLPDSSIALIRQWISEGANEVVTSNEQEDLIADGFQLIGNYPNPFNPSTQIRFEVPVSTRYTITVYSVHGQLLSEQVGNANPGLVRATLNMAKNPSGIYIYRVNAQVNGIDQLIGTGRMTLIK